MSRKHGVSDEDVAREAEQDKRNARVAGEGGWCCLTSLLISVSSVALAFAAA